MITTKEKAERLVRALCRDLELYQQELIRETRRTGLVSPALAEDLANSRAVYLDHVAPEVEGRVEILDVGLLALLSSGGRS